MASLVLTLFKDMITKALTRLCGCAACFSLLILACNKIGLSHDNAYMVNCMSVDLKFDNVSFFIVLGL